MDIPLTNREFNAIIYAYARLEYEIDNGMFPDEPATRSAQGAVKVLEGLIDKVNAIIQKEGE